MFLAQFIQLYGGQELSSRNNFQNREKTFIIKKKVSESRKKMLKSKKMFQSHSRKKPLYEIEKIFKIKKNILESRKKFQN